MTDSPAARWNRNSPGNLWRDTVTNMMDGYWFSTQTVGHCNATDGDGGAAAADAEAAGAEQCTWRVPQV